MRALTASELLAVWEHGLRQSPLEQALALLEAACPDEAPDDLARLSIGERDARLLTLREWIFGPRFVSVAACPACGARLEMTFDVADIRVVPPNTGPPEPAVLEVGDVRAVFRTPNSHDLAAVAATGVAADARQVLLERIVFEACREDGTPVRVAELPSAAGEAILERVAALDPGADIQVELVCPACQHAWQAVYDVVSYFWSEIHAWAVRTLREVHLLALAYGWREADILAMTPQRRQTYLEMLSG